MNNRVINVVLLLGIATNFFSVAIASNQLQNHPSPYLAMHGQDPVAWQNWDKKFFKQAADQNKLVFVSIGYYACHWCHVMQRESYQNAEIAKILNDTVISIKVDRELQPALDARLINFVERTRGYAGWPLNVFITPEGYPLLGFVYLPPQDFKELIVNVNKAWQENPAKLKATAKAAAVESETSDTTSGPQLDEKKVDNYLKNFKQTAMQQADSFMGGFGEESKFPIVPQLTLLLESYKRDQDRVIGDFVKLTLDKMASQGLHDHLRGGFYRYTVDPGWLIPHFEKMLYDNAQLALLYLQAADIFNHEYYREVAYKTLDFMITELFQENAMISSLSAIDSNNVEGGYYLWSDEELERLLTPLENQLLKKHWGMIHAATLDAGHHPHIAITIDELAKQQNKPAAEVRQLIQSAKQKLLSAQLKRQLPADDKKLAAWNALALSALVKTGLGKKRYQQAALKIHRFLASTLWDGKQLYRAMADNQALGDVTLEDYAYMAAAMWAWAEYTGHKNDYAFVQQLVDQAWQRYYNNGGWILSDDLIAGLSSREPVIADSPMPSPSATLIRVSLALARIQQDRKKIASIKSSLNRGHTILQTDNFWYSTHILGMLEALKPETSANRQ